MAKIDDLIHRIEDDDLRVRLAAAFSELTQHRSFGLVFERHQPEGMFSEGTIKPGRRVSVTSNKTRVGTVQSIAGQIAEIDFDGTIAEHHPIDQLLIARTFGEPIYPMLEVTGTTEHGGHKPFHMAVEAENFHALQMLEFTHKGRIDCIYLDPPYNSGAKDWKYNNSYVDRNDRYRHSKWLSFMERRLELCRPLLTPNGVLIVTIDDNEVHHLGVLLEQIFPEADIQMVTIVMNSAGSTSPGEKKPTNLESDTKAALLFSRCDEYAFFCSVWRGKSQHAGNRPTGSLALFTTILVPDTPKQWAKR